MPTVEFETKEFLKLVGKSLPLEELGYKIAMLGTDPDEISDEKLIIEVFPNRPDLLSIEGFAKALRDFIGEGKGFKELDVSDAKESVAVDASVEGIRPYIAAAIVRKIEITDKILESIMQVQESLHTSHGRKRAKVAIGIHDLDKLHGPFRYAAVEANSLDFVPLDFRESMCLGHVLEKHPKGQQYKHLLEGNELSPVVLDQEGVVSMPPIINADRTRVTEKSKNLFIEITGTNKHAVHQALNIILMSLSERGGKIEAVKIGNEKSPKLNSEAVLLKTNYATKLLGVEVEVEDFKKLLGKMGYGVAKATDTEIEVLVPAYRTDVLHPIDIVEDLAIAYGYENFPSKAPNINTVASDEKINSFCSELRPLMIGMGFQEIVSFVLTNEKKLENAHVKGEPIKIKNPRVEEFAVIRNSLLPGLLECFALNKKKGMPQKIFELDDIVMSKKEYTNVTRLSFGKMSKEVNLAEIQATVKAILDGLGVIYKLNESDESGFIPGRCGRVNIGREKVGYFGEVHPEILEAFGIDYPVIIAELDVEGIYSSLMA
jgi:phenylalanyl-tRNA synthetase beta chain